MALRNPETVARLLDRMTGSMKNLKLMVKSQQPIEDFIKKIESTEDIINQLTSTLEREGSPLRNG
jgi:flagellin-specific chaperone FliS|tara:strand:- start:30 stop:224 length:195 start_codon:yes stop_codon:yes gene_type:complete